MSRIGVLGGLGPSATVDFMDRIVKLTPASCDQEHIPVLTASFPHVHDRSRHILGLGPDPLPQLLSGLRLLNEAGVGVIAIPCNSAHHWYAELSAASKAPILHIAEACVAAVPAGGAGKVAVFATRGALASGFYQRALQARGIEPLVPDAAEGQVLVDNCIREIKASQFEAGGQSLAQALSRVQAQGASAVIMGCTELPIAARYAGDTPLALIDSTLELARATVGYALQREWNKPQWAS